MPAISGIEIQRRVTKSNTNAPIVFVTALDDQGDRQTVFEADARTCLHKPFSEAQLFARTLAATTDHAFTSRRVQVRLTPELPSPSPDPLQGRHSPPRLGLRRQKGLPRLRNKALFPRSASPTPR